MAKFSILLVLAIAALAQESYATPRRCRTPSLDTTFGAQLINFGTPAGRDTAYGILDDSCDDSYVVTGPVSVGQTDFGVARILYEGGLDTSFGNGGKTWTDFMGPGTRTDVALDVVMQRDRKLVVGGTAQMGPPGVNNLQFALARYYPNGTLDTSFGDGGRVLTDIDPSGANDEIFSIALDQEENIYATGFSNPNEIVGNGPNFNFGTAKYLPNGQLDVNFGDGGKLITTFGPSTDDRARTLLVDHQDGIIIGGRSRVNDGTNQSTEFNLALARYDNAGRPVSWFGNFLFSNHRLYPNLAPRGSGLVINNLGNVSEIIKMVSLGGGIFLAGGNLGSSMYVSRFLANGRLDPTFGTDGVAVISWGAGVNNIFNSMTVDPCGNIYVAGNAQLNGVNRFAIAKLTRQGELDSSFFNQGLGLFTFPNVTSGFVREVIFDSFGRLVAAGEAVQTGFSSADFIVFRLKF